MFALYFFVRKQQWWWCLQMAESLSVLNLEIWPRGNTQTEFQVSTKVVLQTFFFGNDSIIQYISPSYTGVSFMLSFPPMSKLFSVNKIPQLKTKSSTY